MKIYPHHTPNGIINLVEKREYDSISLLAHDLATELERLNKAFAHLSTRLLNIAFDPSDPMHFAEDVANHVDDLRDEINAQNVRARLISVAKGES